MLQATFWHPPLKIVLCQIKLVGTFWFPPRFSFHSPGFKGEANQWFIIFKALCRPLAVPAYTASHHYSSICLVYLKEWQTVANSLILSLFLSLFCSFFLSPFLLLYLSFSLTVSSLQSFFILRKRSHHPKGCPLGGRLVVGLPGVISLLAPFQHSLLVPAPLVAKARGGAEQAGERKRDDRGPRQKSQPQTHWHCQRFFFNCLVNYLHLPFTAPYYSLFTGPIASSVSMSSTFHFQSDLQSLNLVLSDVIKYDDCFRQYI